MDNQQVKTKGLTLPGTFLLWQWWVLWAMYSVLVGLPHFGTYLNRAVQIITSEITQNNYELMDSFWQFFAHHSTRIVADFVMGIFGITLSGLLLAGLALVFWLFMRKDSAAFSSQKKARLLKIIIAYPVVFFLFVWLLNNLSAVGLLGTLFFYLCFLFVAVLTTVVTVLVLISFQKPSNQSNDGGDDNKANYDICNHARKVRGNGFQNILIGIGVCKTPGRQGD